MCPSVCARLWVYLITIIQFLSLGPDQIYSIVLGAFLLFSFDFLLFTTNIVLEMTWGAEWRHTHIAWLLPGQLRFQTTYFQFLTSIDSTKRHGGIISKSIVYCFPKSKNPKDPFHHEAWSLLLKKESKKVAFTTPCQVQSKNSYLLAD